jgi:hypothetical protein
MSAIQSKPQLLGSSGFDAQRSSSRISAAAKLVELGRALARTESGASMPGFCSQCCAPRPPYGSSAQNPTVFCSEQCERKFVRAALASLTIDDCIRLQRRLESLLKSVEAAAIGALSGGS